MCLEAPQKIFHPQNLQSQDGSLMPMRRKRSCKAQALFLCMMHCDPSGWIDIGLCTAKQLVQLRLAEALSFNLVQPILPFCMPCLVRLTLIFLSRQYNKVSISSKTLLIIFQLAMTATKKPALRPGQRSKPTC